MADSTIISRTGNSTSAHTHINSTNHNKILKQNNPHEETNKILADKIGKNIKDMEIYLLLNLKLKKALSELIQAYYCSDQENLQKNYEIIKETLRIIKCNMNNFEELLKKNMVTKTSLRCNITEFNSLFDEKRKENMDNLRMHENSGKYSFCLFRRFLCQDKDQILREFFRCELQGLTRKYVCLFLYERIDDRNPIEALDKKFNPYLSIIEKKEKKEKNHYFLINVMNSFQIHLKFDSDNFTRFRLNVFSIDEYINLSNFANLNEVSLKKDYFYSILLKKVSVEDKSKFALFRKISKLFEERLTIFIKLSPKNGIKFIPILNVFLSWIKNYNDLFQKRCFHCKCITKLNKLDNIFYPPFYKLLDFDSDNFFHEECFNLINNAHL